MAASTDDLARKVGKNVRIARWLKSWSQETAAHRAGIGVRYWADVERGVRNPSLSVLAAIAGALDVSVADLVNVEGMTRLRTPLYRQEKRARPPPRSPHGR